MIQRMYLENQLSSLLPSPTIHWFLLLDSLHVVGYTYFIFLLYRSNEFLKGANRNTCVRPAILKNKPSLKFDQFFLGEKLRNRIWCSENSLLTNQNAYICVSFKPVMKHTSSIYLIFFDHLDISLFYWSLEFRTQSTFWPHPSSALWTSITLTTYTWIKNFPSSQL